MEHPRQLEFFQEKSEIDCLREEITLLRREMERQRRATLSRHNTLCKEFINLKEDNERLTQRLASLEKLFNTKDPNHDSADDYLIKLFAQAYLAS